MAKIGDFYIVRTTNAGVHTGCLVDHFGGQHIALKNARRVWRWRGANTLSELSQKGCDIEWTRISEPVPRIELFDAIELIPCSDEAEDNLTISRWG